MLRRRLLAIDSSFAGGDSTSTPDASVVLEAVVSPLRKSLRRSQFVLTDLNAVPSGRAASAARPGTSIPAACAFRVRLEDEHGCGDGRENIDGRCRSNEAATEAETAAAAAAGLAPARDALAAVRPQPHARVLGASSFGSGRDGTDMRRRALLHSTVRKYNGIGGVGSAAGGEVDRLRRAAVFLLEQQYGTGRRINDNDNSYNISAIIDKSGQNEEPTVVSLSPGVFEPVSCAPASDPTAAPERAADVSASPSVFPGPVYRSVRSPAAAVAAASDLPAAAAAPTAATAGGPPAAPMLCGSDPATGADPAVQSLLQQVSALHGQVAVLTARVSALENSYAAAQQRTEEQQRQQERWKEAVTRLLDARVHGEAVRAAFALGRALPGSTPSTAGPRTMR